MAEGLGDWWRDLKLGLALATLVAGSIVVASGFANVGAGILQEFGLPSPVATQLGVALAAAIPPTIAVAVLATVGADPRYRGSAILGGGITLGGIGVAMTLSFVHPVAIGLYAAGLLVIVASLVRGVLGVTEPDGVDRVTPQYSASRVDNRVTPADGGEDDDDLEFPLDDEE